VSTEAERVVAIERRAVGSDQLAPHERGKSTINLRGERLAGERVQRQSVEHLALDRAALEHLALLDAELL
jgi:hypothetical protein